MLEKSKKEEKNKVKSNETHGSKGGTSRSFLFLIVTISIIEIQSAPLAKLYPSSYQYPQMIHPEYYQIAHQNALAPYYIYNLLQVHTDLTSDNPILLPEKQTTLTHLPPYGYYYYDFRFPINPIYPVLSPSRPGFIPGSGSPPISTQRPFVDVDNDDDSGIEKLDTKIEPDNKPNDNDGIYEDDDTITVEAVK